MRRLDEAEDDASLEEGQRAEERVGSVDYDAWACPACSFRFTLRYPKWMTVYDKCPQCLNRTKSSTETVVERATVHGAGSARVVEQCAFCNHHVDIHESPAAPRAEHLVGFVEGRVQLRRGQIGRRRGEPGVLTERVVMAFVACGEIRGDARCRTDTMAS